MAFKLHLSKLSVLRILIKSHSIPFLFINSHMCETFIMSVLNEPQSRGFVSPAFFETMLNCSTVAAVNLFTNPTSQRCDNVLTFGTGISILFKISRKLGRGAIS